MKRQICLIMSCMSAILIGCSAFAKSEMTLKSAISSDKEKIKYQVTGNKKGSTLVFIHGFPLSSQMWNSQIDFFKKEYHIIAVDLRGAGYNKNVRFPFTMELLVDDLFAILDNEKIENPIIVGFSMGGFLSLRAIEREPSRFKAIVLSNTKSNADSNESKLKRNEAIKTLRTKGTGDYADVFLKSATSPNTSQEILKDIKNIITKETTPQSIAFSALALISRTDTTESLAKIKVPTLIFVGDQDNVTKLSSAQELQKSIQGSQLKIITNSGHMSPIENSKVYNEELNLFLKTLNSSN